MMSSTDDPLLSRSASATERRWTWRSVTGWWAEKNKAAAKDKDGAPPPKATPTQPPREAKTPEGKKEPMISV